MNRQEIFNKVYDYAKTMQGPSYFMEDGINPTCAYRGCNGNKCLIGALIPDSFYCKEMESNVIDIVLAEYPDLDDYFEMEEYEDVQFLLQLQSCHDNSCIFNHRFVPDQIPLDLFKQQLMENLKDFAESYELNCT